MVTAKRRRVAKASRGNSEKDGDGDGIDDDVHKPMPTSPRRHRRSVGGFHQSSSAPNGTNSQPKASPDINTINTETNRPKRRRGQATYTQIEDESYNRNNSLLQQPQTTNRNHPAANMHKMQSIDLLASPTRPNSIIMESVVKVNIV